MRFTQPPTINTGDVLCKVQMDGYRLNDEYFNAIADAWRPIPASWDRGFIASESAQSVYDSYHLLRADAKTLCYYLYAAGSDIVAKLVYDGVQVAQVWPAVSPVYGTYDLSGKSAGLYRCQYTLYNENGGSGWAGLRPPYTRYTGSKTYTTPPTITDGNVSQASHFQKWGDNDLYFKDVTHPNPAFTGMGCTFIASGLTRDLWYGWDRFHPDHYRMQYKIEFAKTGGDCKIRLYYDAGGGNEQYMDITTSGVHTGYWDLSSPGNYTKGDFYKVYAKLQRPSDEYDAAGIVYYLYMSPPALDSSYTTMDQFAAGQYVYGSTGGQDTRLALLSSNDNAIRDRLIWADETTGRMDYCVAKSEYVRLGGTDSSVHAMVRRFNLLYYRTLNAELSWGSESQRLEDFDDGAGITYRILDLNSLGIPFGQVYQIAGDQVLFAMEL